MASPDVLNFVQLLAPISGQNPAGIDLRVDRKANPDYDKVKDARSAARAAERMLLAPGSDDKDVQKAQHDAARTVQEKWPLVRDVGPKIIAEKSKDLEITAWMIEALVRQNNGYAGLRDGFRLARELIERFWDLLYPRPDEDGMETRLAPLTGLNGDEADGTLIIPIKNVPITEKQADQPLTCFGYQQAVELQSLDETKRAQRVAQGAVPMQVFDQAVAASPADFFVNLIDDIKQCSAEFDKLNAVLEQKCGREAPPSSNIRNSLESCLEIVQNMAKDKLAAIAPVQTESASTPGGQPGAQAPGTGVAAGPIRSREDAFRMLLLVAEFFRRTEPHTPLSYALEQAVRWGKMSLPELLVELIPEDSARTNLFKLVGIKPPEKSN